MNKKRKTKTLKQNETNKGKHEKANRKQIIEQKNENTETKQRNE